MRVLLAVIAVAACRHGAAPPPQPSCTGAADHVLALIEPKDELARDIRAVFANRCTADAWPADMRSCVMSTVSLKDPKHCKARLTLTARARLEADLAAAQGRAKDRAIPEACRAYADEIDKLLRCDKVPQAARDAMRQGFDATKQTWSGPNAAPRATAAENCKTMAASMKQVSVSMGC